MSLNGSGGELIYENGKGWHSRSEDGARIEAEQVAFRGVRQFSDFGNQVGPGFFETFEVVEELDALSLTRLEQGLVLVTFLAIGVLQSIHVQGRLATANKPRDLIG